MPWYSSNRWVKEDEVQFVRFFISSFHTNEQKKFLIMQRSTMQFFLLLLLLFLTTTQIFPFIGRKGDQEKRLKSFSFLTRAAFAQSFLLFLSQSFRIDSLTSTSASQVLKLVFTPLLLMTTVKPPDIHLRYVLALIIKKSAHFNPVSVD